MIPDELGAAGIRLRLLSFSGHYDPAMPELPEVETVVRLNRARLEGRVVRGFVSRWKRQVIPGVPLVTRMILNKRIARLWRRAKWIVADLEQGGHLLIHLRMSGRIEWNDARLKEAAMEPPHVRATFDFDDGSRLYFCDARKFGRIQYVDHLSELEASLGIEPLDATFTAVTLAAALTSRKRSLKPLLLDQKVIAGIGNIYADEALFDAGLHPLRKTHRLKPDEIAVLHRAIVRALSTGIEHNGTSFDWIYPEGRMQDHLQVYGRAGEPCKRCGGKIVAMRVGQRGTHICPTCQPRSRRRAPAMAVASKPNSKKPRRSD